MAVLAGGADEPEQHEQDRQARDRLLLVGHRDQVARDRVTIRTLAIASATPSAA